MSLNSIASFPGGTRPVITAQILGQDRRWHSVSGLLDTGNDVTLFTKAATQSLGFGRDRAPKAFKVRGIAAAPMNFYMVQTMMKVGNTQPIKVNIGLQLDNSATSLRDNLFGRKDILDNFDLYFSKGKTQLHQTHGTGIGNTLGISLPIIKNSVPANYVSSYESLCEFTNIC